MITKPDVRLISLSQFTTTFFEWSWTLLAADPSIFAANKYSCKRLNLEQYCLELIFEVTAVEVQEISTILLAVYRSPDSDLDRFQEQLELCLQHITSRNASKKIIIGGDFNIHLEKPSREELSFTNLLRSFGLYITTRLPTRGEACLDTAATNIDTWECTAEVVSALVSDHDGAVILSVKTELVSIYPSCLDNYTSYKRIVDCEQFPVLRRELEVSNCCLPQCVLDPKSAFSNFFESFKNTFDCVFPAKIVKKPRSASKNGDRAQNKLWFTPELARLRAWTLYLHDLYKAEDDPIIKTKYFSLYTKTKRGYSSRAREVRKAFNAEQIKQASNTCKAAWDLVNAHRKTNTKPKPSLTPDELNTYFVQVADKIVAEFPLSHTNPCDSLHDITPRHAFTDWKSVSSSLVLKIVKGFKDSKSQDTWNFMYSSKKHN